MRGIYIKATGGTIEVSLTVIGVQIDHPIGIPCTDYWAISVVSNMVADIEWQYEGEMVKCGLTFP